MSMPDISESEWIVMEALWEKSPQTGSQVAQALREGTGWATTTVRTLLARLVEKKALHIRDNAEGVREFSPAVKREACVRAESASFLERVFRGAEKSLLTHFVSQAKLTPAEAKELKTLLDKAIQENS